MPYLLNPAGIVVLVTASADAASVGRVAVVFGLVMIVLALDVAVFRWANRVSDHLDESRMLITEKCSGFLLAALVVQLALNGLDAAGVIHLSGREVATGRAGVDGCFRVGAPGIEPGTSRV